jgi:hypothetical protein
MRLKELVRQETLENILSGDAFIDGYCDRIGLKPGEEKVVDSGTFMEFMSPILFSAMLSYLKKNSPETYKNLKEQIEKNKGDAEINIRELEKKVPLMKPINYLFNIYGPKHAYQKNYAEYLKQNPSG